MAERLNVVLCCHAHLPDCRDLVTGEFQQPWVYLRTIGEYAELAGFLEDTLAARAVVCISPIVLEQIADYRDQLEGWLRDGHRLGDPVLGLLSAENHPLSHEERAAVCEMLLGELPGHVVQRFPACASLLDLVGAFFEKRWDFRWLSDVCIGDLLVWLHLAWLAPCAHRDDLRVELLAKKASGFSSAERRVVVEIIADLLAAIPQRYRSLHERGRIELATSLYTSPSLRVLRATGAAATPPGLEDEADWSASAQQHLDQQLDKGVEAFEAFFGFAPHGCFILEEQPSTTLDGRLARRNIDWLATDATTLTTSTSGAAESRLASYALADAISGGDVPDAGRVLEALESMIKRCEHPGACVVPILFDCAASPTQSGKTLGAFFELCSLVAAHPALELSTFARALSSRLKPCHLNTEEGRQLPPSDRGAPNQQLWQMVIDAKEAYLDVVGSHSLPAHRLQAATRQLMVCEDRTWLCDTHPLVDRTQSLCRMHIQNLYRMLGVPVPAGVNECTNNGR